MINLKVAALLGLTGAALAATGTAIAGGRGEMDTSPPTEQVTVTGIRPNNTTRDFWIEDAYSQYASLGPRFAKGLIIWNNSTDAYGTGATVPPPKFLEGFAARGWDVIRVQRNWRLGGSDGPRGFAELTLNRATLVNAVSGELRQATADGYQRVILAGQGMGGALAMEAAVANPGLYGVIALAPNVGFLAGTGIGSQRAAAADNNNIGDTLNGQNAEWTTDMLQRFRPQRAVVVFPSHDEQVPGLERGAKARATLAQRNDLSYLLVDETSNLYGHNGANGAAFLPIAACIDGLMDPAFASNPGEVACGRDEVPAVLSEIGVKPAPGRSWFGYSTTGMETYLEIPADNNGPVTFATGRGALWNMPGSVRQYAANRTADSVTFKLDGQQAVTGLWKAGALRMTVDAPDGTRAAIDMVPVN